jgi:hypothetical protein
VRAAIAFGAALFIGGTITMVLEGLRRGVTMKRVAARHAASE